MNLKRVIEILRMPAGYSKAEHAEAADWIESQEPYCWKVVGRADIDWEEADARRHAEYASVSKEYFQLYAAPVCDLKALAEECFANGAAWRGSHSFELPDAIIARHTKVGA